MAGCPSVSWVFFSQEIVGIYKSTPSHFLVLNRVMHSQSHSSVLGWLQRLSYLLLILSHTMPHNTSLGIGHNPAEAEQISGYSAMPAPRGAWDADWRSLLYHYSLELLTAKKWFCWISTSSPVTSPPPMTLSRNPRPIKLNRPFPQVTLGLHAWMVSGERAEAHLQRRTSSVQMQAPRFPGPPFRIAASQTGHKCSTVTYWTRSH